MKTSIIILIAVSLTAFTPSMAVLYREQELSLTPNTAKGIEEDNGEKQVAFKNILYNLETKRQPSESTAAPLTVAETIIPTKTITTSPELENVIVEKVPMVKINAEDNVAARYVAKIVKNEPSLTETRSIQPEHQSSFSLTDVLPQVLKQPLNINELISSLAQIPPNIVKTAQNLLKQLQQLFENYAPFNSIFTGISALLKNQNFLQQTAITGKDVPLLSNLSLVTPAAATILELAGYGVQTGGDLIKTSGKMADSVFENMKDTNDLIQKNTKFLKEVPYFGAALDPISQTTNALLDASHTVVGERVKNAGQTVTDIGENLLKKGVQRRLSNSRY